MAYGWYITFVLWMLLACARHCACLCPEGFSGFTEVFHCLKNITHGLNGGMNVLAGTTTQTIRHYCQNGTFNDTVHCLSGLYSECKHRRGQEPLRQIARPELWQHGVHMICNSLNEHALYSDCIAEQRSGIYKCLEYNDDMFVKETKHHKKDWQSLTFDICRYYTGMRVCTGRQVQENCNVAIGQLLEDYIATITPLLCKNRGLQAWSSDYHSSAPSLSWRRGKYMYNTYPVIIAATVYYSLTWRWPLSHSNLVTT